MKILTKIALLLLPVLILSCNLNSQHKQVAKKRYSNSAPGDVIFTIDSAGLGANRMINFYYHDSLAHGHPVYINKNETKLELNAPAFFFRPNAEQTPFLIYPGEKIKIISTANDGMELLINGDQQRTNELNFFSKLVQKTGNIYYAYTFMPYHKKVNFLTEIQGLEGTINKVKNTRLQFLASYYKQYSVSNSFINIAVNTIENTALTDTLLLYFNNRDLLKKQNLYQKLLAEKMTAIKGTSMAPFQVCYRSRTMLLSLSLGNPPDFLVQTDNDFIKRFAFVETNFAGATRNFLMAHTLCTAYNNTVSVSKAYIHKFDTLCTDPGYRNLVDRTFGQTTISYPPGSNKLLSTDGKTMQDMQSMISLYRGKILLLDFWASWCGPCREEIPFMQALEKQYENKNIAFVSISTDQNVNDWQRANKEESLAVSRSFLLLNAARSSFVKRYNIHSIPRFLLIGKQGNIISEDAPRPSDQKLKALVDKNL